LQRTKDYGHKCHILRQIQSNKARRFRRINAAQNIATVVVSSFLAFIGFSGIDKITTYLNWVGVVDRVKVEFAFNTLVFVLFVLAILHLVFQFGKKQSDAERAIVSLTNLINEVEDLVSRSETGFGQISDNEHNVIREKYDMLIQVIPANSDREFLRAKNDYQKKEAKQAQMRFGPQDLFDDRRHRSAVLLLIQRSSTTSEILRVLRDLDAKLYLGGGLVRNLVWDYLHNFRSPTPVDDVDVVCFDPLNSKKEHDQQLEQRLREKVPNFRWSVKNQARMHMVNGDEPYSSLEDAISKWPETATAIAVRLEGQGKVEILAPHGFGDLFRLLVVPTPHFEKRLDRVRERVMQKQWEKTWPKLRILVPPPAGAQPKA
jgi:hypothetical protein